MKMSCTKFAVLVNWAIPLKNSINWKERNGGKAAEFLRLN